MTCAGRRVACVSLFAALVLPTAVSGQDGAAYWPQWRGPHGTGSASVGDPPLAWAEEQHVRWKIPVPGSGSSSPIVWGDRVYVLTAVPTGDEGGSSGGLFGRIRRRFTGGVGVSEWQEYRVLAVAREDGRVLWERSAATALPHEGRHNTGSWASPSGVADADQVCAFFGSVGLFCYDHDGELLWDRDFGDMDIRMDFGEGASPVLFGDALVVNWDHQGPSFITALDKRTGEERWRVERDEITSWSTPLVVPYDGGAQVVTSATNRVRSYDLATGDIVWESEGVTLNAIPTPVAGDGLVYVTSGYRGNRLLAIRLDRASGNVMGGDAVAWSLERDTPYVPSPLLHDGILYLIKSNSGVLSAFDAPTGRRLYGPERLPGIRSVYSSPVAVDDRVYVVGRDGTTVVLRAGSQFEVLAQNALDEDIDASPALAGNEIYLRGAQHLYCIAPAS